MIETEKTDYRARCRELDFQAKDLAIKNEDLAKAAREREVKIAELMIEIERLKDAGRWHQERVNTLMSENTGLVKAVAVLGNRVTL
jgi:chromosome segregation ATPase